MKPIPVYEPWLTAADAEAVAGVVHDGWVSSAGRELEAFEREWAAYCGMPHGVAAANGTAALELALIGLGVGAGDEVICPSFTIISCARAILAVGAEPVLVDADPETFCMQMDEVEAKLGPRTRAIMAVHLFGHPVEAERLLALRGEVAVLEDAAEAHGVEVRVDGRWRRCGGLAEASVFSFYANKAITTGEGGMLLARQAAVAERARAAANLFFKPQPRFEHDELGHNYRLTNLQAALGLAQLSRIDAILARKRAVWAAYAERLADVPALRLQGAAEWARPVPWMVTVLLTPEAPVDRAADLAERLAADGIQTRPLFLGMHRQPVFRDRPFASGSFPVCDELSRRGLYLPSSPTLGEAEIDRVCAAVRRALGLTAASARPSAGADASGDAAANGEANVEADADATAFGEAYARAYDHLYADKDYAGEVAAVNSALATWGTGSIRRLLDLGCGTGRHLIRLAGDGRVLVGVDRSAAMLAIARARCAEAKVEAELVESTVAGLDLAPAPAFDAALLMFAVLSYHPSDAEVLAALRAVRRHLRPGGLLVGDFWYGPAVMAEPPTERVKRVPTPAGELVREAAGEHDSLAQVVTVRYRVSGGGLPAPATEAHRMRYFFPVELRSLLARGGFELLHLGGWPEVDAPPSAAIYAASLVARAW